MLQVALLMVLSSSPGWAVDSTRACVERHIAELTDPVLKGRSARDAGMEQTAVGLVKHFEALGLKAPEAGRQQAFVVEMDRYDLGSKLTIDGHPIEVSVHAVSGNGSFDTTLVAHNARDVTGKAVLLKLGNVTAFAVYLAAVRARQRGAVAVVAPVEFWVRLQDGFGYAPRQGSAVLPDVGIPVLAIHEDERVVVGARVVGEARGTGVRAQVSNVVGVVPGRGSLAEEIVVLGAHYDGVGPDQNGRFHPAADDNASGTAVMLCAVEALETAPGPRRTLVVIAFAGEELGLIGSAQWLNTSPLAPRVVSMVNLDMVGRLLDDGFLSAETDEVGLWAPLLLEAAGTRALETRFDTTSGSSDHVSFRLRAIPSIHLHTRIDDRHHEPYDTADGLDMAGMTTVSRVVSQLVGSMVAGNGPAGPLAGCGSFDLGLFGLDWGGEPVVRCVRPGVARWLEPGDRILQIDGLTVRNANEVWLDHHDQRVPVTILRDGHRLDLARPE